MSIVGEEGWELWVYGYSTFVLQVSDLDVETFDLPIKLTLLAGVTMKMGNCTYKNCCFVA